MSKLEQIAERRTVIMAPRHFCQNEQYPVGRGVTKGLLEEAKGSKQDYTEVLRQAHDARSARLQELLQVLSPWENKAIRALTEPQPDYTVESALMDFETLVRDILEREALETEQQALERLAEQNAHVIVPTRQAIDRLWKAVEDRAARRPTLDIEGIMAAAEKKTDGKGDLRLGFLRR